MRHSTKKLDRPRLCDWPAKKLLLKAHYGVLGDKGLVAAVAGGFFTDSGKMMGFIEKTSDTLRRWRTGACPTGENSLQFWDWVIKDCRLDITVSQALSCSISEFIGFFRQDHRLSRAVRELTADDASIDSDVKLELQRRYGSQAAPRVAVASADEYIVHGHSRISFEGPLTGMEKGRIHVHQFYCMPETAKAWAALVDSNHYRMYMDCWLSLRALVASSHWKDAVCNGRYNAAVALGGGGSPEKDRVLAGSLLDDLKDEEQRLSYFINDISEYMLHESARMVLRGPITDEAAQRIKIKYLLRDFLLLDEHFNRPTDWDCAVWAILGGTIGNVSERDFFRSIGGPSRAGDLLIVGVDTIGEDTRVAFEKRMKTQYRSTELDALLLTPLRGTAGRQGDGPVVDVSVVAGPERNEYSNIPNAWTAVFSSPSLLGGSPVVLAVSTRYALDDFIEYAGRFGWEHLGTTPAPSTSTFRQLLLRRVT